MALPRITSPHVLGNNRTQQVMLHVSLATLPGFLVLTWHYGIGPLINLVLATLVALAVEALMLQLRQRPVRFFLCDGSALLTAVLLALALPPYCPWWVTTVAAAFAMGVGKQLYGGLGQNPFNPAMVGYVVVLVSFPVELTSWPVPHHNVSFLDGLAKVFVGTPLADGWSQATALDLMMNNQGLTLNALWQNPAFGYLGGQGSEGVNLAFLLGGLYLLRRGIFSWHAPVGMLATLLLMSLLFWGEEGSNAQGSPLFHLFTGATMLGAFFIITDPVTGATSPQGRLIFGMGIGLLVYVIRAWGGYPDGVAFAVLLMNLAAPTLDYYTRPRTYGHDAPRRGLNQGD